MGKRAVRTAVAMHLVAALLVAGTVRADSYAPPVLPPDEALEIAVGSADAIVEGFVTGPWDTTINTGPGRTTRESHLGVSVRSKLKGPLGLGPGSSLRVLVGPESWERGQLDSRRGGRDPLLLFLFRNDPGRVHPGLIQSDIGWVLQSVGNHGVVGLDSVAGRAIRDRTREHVRRQSLPSLVRDADLVVVGKPAGNGDFCPGPHGTVCLDLAIDSVVVGSLSSVRVPITVRGFGIRNGMEPAIYFLRGPRDGRYTIVRRTGGVIQPRTDVRPEWFAFMTGVIRRLRPNGP